jgi:hypothetical protein
VTYEGQPEYVRTGFLRDLFETWCEQAVSSDEWGELVIAWWGAASAEISAGGSEGGHVRFALARVREELDRAFEEDWWGVREDYEDGIRRAQEDYGRIVEYWRARAKGFKGEAALEDEIAKLPSWVRPDPNAEPLPDPELAEYERLRKKFKEAT